MTNTIVAVPFDEELANYIGKKGSENSLTFYNRKVNDDTVIALMPSSIEEKFYAMPQSFLIADQILISTKTIDKLFGEALIGCSLLGKKVLLTKDNDVSIMINGLKLAATPIDKESILDTIINYKRGGEISKQVRVDIDKAFNVKGVGVITLGIVTEGILKVHDSLFHNSGKTITVRSIQSQDEDVKEAGVGTRVGIAIKGMDEESIKKGDVFSTSQIKPSKILELNVKGSEFAKESIEKGKFYSIAIGFSYVVVSIEEVDGNKVTVKLEKEIPVRINDNFLMVRTISPRIFACGVITKIN
jgi:selenocysteine-specific translation elongation factor